MLAEYDGAVFSEKGLDVEKVAKHRKETGSILNCPGTTNLTTSREVLELECDILVPAALERQITTENAARIKARIIGEAANGPVTAEAERILAEKNVFIIPDAYLNAGGVTVSYFEWLKNLSHVRFGRMSKRYEEGTHAKLIDVVEQAIGRKLSPEMRRQVIHGADEIDLVNSGLEETMFNAYDSIRETMMSTKGCPDLRTGAFIDAINKIAISYMQMGIFP